MTWARLQRIHARTIGLLGAVALFLAGCHNASNPYPVTAFLHRCLDREEISHRGPASENGEPPLKPLPERARTALRQALNEARIHRGSPTRYSGGPDHIIQAPSFVLLVHTYPRRVPAHVVLLHTNARPELDGMLIEADLYGFFAALKAAP